MNVVKRAADTLRIHRAQALGHLAALWSWLSEESETGDITAYTDTQLEERAGWTGEPGAFARFVRERHASNGRIRDWDEYMGPLVTVRKKARERMKSRRAEQRKLQDADADREFGPGGSSNGQGNHANIQDVRTNTDSVRGTSGDVRAKSSTRIELRKSIRTTGMYLCEELDIKNCLSNDERAYKGPLVKNQNDRDASTLYGTELVRAFCTRFYAGKDADMLDTLQRLRAVLRPSGLRFQGQTVRATPKLVALAMNETLANPPAIADAAIVFVLKKLSNGHLHETRTASGELVTEALASESKTLERELAQAFASDVTLSGLVAMVGRTLPQPTRFVHAPRTISAGANETIPPPS